MAAGHYDRHYDSHYDTIIGECIGIFSCKTGGSITDLLWICLDLKLPQRIAGRWRQLFQPGGASGISGAGRAGAAVYPA